VLRRPVETTAVIVPVGNGTDLTLVCRRGEIANFGVGVLHNVMYFRKEENISPDPLGSGTFFRKLMLPLHRFNNLETILP
jgi:hypothetical protein